MEACTCRAEHLNTAVAFLVNPNLGTRVLRRIVDIVPGDLPSSKKEHHRPKHNSISGGGCLSGETD
jgi:hypothetical protein